MKNAKLGSFQRPHRSPVSDLPGVHRQMIGVRENGKSWTVGTSVVGLSTRNANSSLVAHAGRWATGRQAAIAEHRRVLAEIRSICPKLI